jgi:uncharacterized protein (TIGR03067 family)
MKRLLSMGAAVVCVVFVSGADDKKEFDPAKVAGNWTYESGVRSGEKVSKEHLAGKVEFTKDVIVVPSGEKDKPFKMAYKINTKHTPALIDMEIKDGPVKEGKAEGIISLEGDELKIAYVVEGQGHKRPTKFESAKDSGVFLFTLKKAK